jgi:predicted PurR-regulated permease PerM
MPISRTRFSSLVASLKIGGSVALAIMGNAVLIPGGAVLPADGLGPVRGAVAQARSARARSAFDSFTNEADAVLGQYLRGQLLVMLILAVYYSVGLALFGLDLAMPIGVFTGLAIFVPLPGFWPRSGAGTAGRPAGVRRQCRAGQGGADGGGGVRSGPAASRAFT